MLHLNICICEIGHLNSVPLSLFKKLKKKNQKPDSFKEVPQQKQEGICLVATTNSQVQSHK